ncbi:MAG: PRC-barrel domain-containing protein, partial [Candidatus Micrarchaeota archaeon]
MSMKMSRLYGMDIYTDTGKFLGKAQDLIIDLERGVVVRITMEPISFRTKDDARRILSEASILYKNVRSVEDVVVVSKQEVPSVKT